MLLLNTCLALTWVAVTGELSFTNLLAGFVISYSVLWFIWREREGADYFKKVRESVRCAALFLWELWSATLRVSIDILSPHPKLRPAIIAISLDNPDDEEAAPATTAEITTLANLITLTPGSLTLEVTDDRKTLYLHTLHAEDISAAKHTVQDGLGKQVRRIFH